MERLYQETHVLLQQTHFAMGHFEQARNESEGQNLARGVSLDEHIGRLDVFVSKEPATRRHTVRMKVDGIKSEVRAAHLAMNSLHSRITTRWRAAADREELMSTRFRPNETSLTMEDHELQMNHRLVGSNRSVDDLLSQGQAVLDNLHAQHSSLRGVKRRFMDVGARLGLSNTTMSMIERRVSEDYMILIAGCIVTLIFMYAFYRFWHG